MEHQINKLKTIVSNAEIQGKDEKQVKLLVSEYLKQFRKSISVDKSL